MIWYCTDFLQKIIIDRNDVTANGYLSLQVYILKFKIQIMTVTELSRAS